MANGNFVVHNGLTVGQLTIDSASGNVATTGSLTTGGWSIVPDGIKLYFSYNGVNVGSLDSSGNFIALANITAFGTP
jgi:hypothetical protein